MLTPSTFRISSRLIRLSRRRTYLPCPVRRRFIRKGTQAEDTAIQFHTQSSFLRQRITGTAPIKTNTAHSPPAAELHPLAAEAAVVSASRSVSGDRFRIGLGSGSFARCIGIRSETVPHIQGFQQTVIRRKGLLGRDSRKIRRPGARPQRYAPHRTPTDRQPPSSATG